MSCLMAPHHSPVTISIIVCMIAFAAAAQPRPSSASSHSAFHTLPAPPSLKIRGASTIAAPFSKAPSAASPPVEYADDIDDGEDFDQGDVQGALSTTFQPGAYVDDDVAGGENIFFVAAFFSCWQLKY